MENIYKRLGFKTPDFLENEYGIKIYLGTVGKADWAVEIPSKIIKRKHEDLSHSGIDIPGLKTFLEQNFVYYSLTESQAIDKSDFWTGIAMDMK